jgi:hypothetical protein
MAESGSAPKEKAQVPAYRDLAAEALRSVEEYKARAQWFELKHEPQIALEYSQLAQEALARAQRYKALADLAEKHS